MSLSGERTGAGLRQLNDQPRDRAVAFARYRATTWWALNIDRLLEVVAAIRTARGVPPSGT